MKHTDVAVALFKGFEEGDEDAVRAVCCPDMVAHQNLNPPMNLDTLLAFSSAVKKVVKDFHYAHARRHTTDSGFVEEHIVQGTLPDGSELRLNACVVAELSDGKIKELREYVDTSNAGNLQAALANAG
jgi:ketosteroid isomerase-like protein